VFPVRYDLVTICATRFSTPKLFILTIGDIFTDALSTHFRGILIDPFSSIDRGILSELLSSYDKGIVTEPLSSNHMGDTQTHTYRQQRDLINLILFFQNKGSRLKRLMRTPCCLCFCVRVYPLTPGSRDS
jgi:hypothetical protein